MIKGSRKENLQEVQRSTKEVEKEVEGNLEELEELGGVSWTFFGMFFDV